MDESRLNALNAYFRAANFLSVGQIYLRSNAMLHSKLKPEHINTFYHLPEGKHFKSYFFSKIRKKL